MKRIRMNRSDAGDIALATATGMGLAWCFPPFAPNPIVGFALLVLAIRSVSRITGGWAWLAGLGFGLGFFVPLLAWLNVVGIDAWIALSILCALWWMAPGALLRRQVTSGWWPLQFALLWSAVEVIRNNFPWGGFGWGSLSLLLLDSPLESVVPYVGQLGGTFLVALLAAGCAAFLSHHRRASVSAALGALLLCAMTLLPNLSTVHGTGGAATIGMVQGDTPSYGLGLVGDPRVTLQMHIDTTQRYLGILNRTDLVIWPESSLQYDINVDAPTQAAVIAVRNQLVPDLLVNMVADRQDGTIANAAVLVQRSGWEEVYAKRHLVPFGEFLPMRSLISRYTSRAQLLSEDFSPGHLPGIVTAGDISLNVLICFEIQDEALALSDPDSASAYVVQTNNATYQSGGESEQQLQYARFRALETRRKVLVVSTSGISAVIDRHGRIIDSIRKGDSDVMVTTMNGTEGRTPAMSLYTLVHNLILVGAVIVLLSAAVRRRRIRT